ncbi:MAG TPA: sulfatase-like hydrolase/transferase, partial [Isosphaeraceae bacterium]|nr:sulfatase-like hydrolase/transferase [Isosphaeraceae bacterium]
MGAMPMISPVAVLEKSRPAGRSGPGLAGGRLRLHHFLVLSVWCGLVSGPLEVGTIVVRKHTVDLNQFYWMSRHFVWLIPLTNLLIFLILGVVLALLALCWPGRGRWLVARLLCALAVLPLLWVAFPLIYGPAGFMLALGIAARLVPLLEKHPAGFRRFVRLSFPALAVVTPVLAASVFVGDRLKEWREEARSLPPRDSPNVLLVVLDTVRADHLSLHGYNRPTSPTLDRLAQPGLHFERVQATSSWTLPSHASLLTGRWPHELSAGWLTPLDDAHPTLAEYLGSRGYATAGFVGNLFYCGSDTGLGRGFTAYRDYFFAELSAFKMAALIDRPVEGLRAIDEFLSKRINSTFFQGLLVRFDAGNRKPAAMVNREFLDWLSRRRQPERPFFTFLNYFDVHYPYKVADGGIHRFGSRPRTEREIDLIEHWRTVDRLGLSAREIAFVRDSYDDCIADLDEQLGRLLDELGRRGILERTWLIVTSDHGESFGEQAGVFGHGTSLYQPQLHVPLVIVPPAGSPSRPSVPETASLRDLPATVVDVLGLGAGAPFPGRSLATL